MAWVAMARSRAYMLLIAFTIVILGVSAHVNAFQGFFYIADQFPLILSLFTLIILIAALTIDNVSSGKSWLSRTVVELCWLGALLITWTGANAFSTSRWSDLQSSDCASIPIDENPDFLGQTKTWCYEVQALRAFVWIEWTSLFIFFVFLLAFCIGHARRGAPHIWATSLSTFDPFFSPRSTRHITPPHAEDGGSSYRASNGRDLDLDFDFAPPQMHQPHLAEEQRYSWPPPPRRDKALVAQFDGVDLGPVPPLQPGQYSQYALPSEMYNRQQTRDMNQGQQWETFVEDDKRRGGGGSSVPRI